MTKVCKFCGQVVETYDDLAEGWEVCSCANAQLARKTAEHIRQGQAIITELFYACEDDDFSQVEEPVAEFLKQAVALVGKEILGKVTAVIGDDGSKTSINRNSKGEIEIQRTKAKRLIDITAAK